MKHCLLLLGIVALVACHKQAAQSFGTAVPGPANPVVTVDPNGNYVGPGGSTAGTTLIVNDAGNPVPSDPTAGDLLNTRYVSNTTVTSAVLWDAGSTPHLVAFRVTNEGTLTAWPQIYCGQAGLDAGGTADAGTAPSYQIRCPAGTPCDWQMPSSTTCGPGATLYSSSTVGSLTVDAGQQALTYEAVVR